MLKPSEKAQTKLNNMFLDLAIGAHNTHCGSKLGGNPAQFLEMINSNIEWNDLKTDNILFDNNKFYFNLSFFENQSLKTVREKLSETYKPSQKYEEAASYLGKNMPSFILELSKLDTKTENMTNLISLLNDAMNIASLLDEKKPTTEKDALEIFAELNEKLEKTLSHMAIFAIRTTLTIERLVKYNLDAASSLKMINDKASNIEN